MNKQIESFMPFTKGIAKKFAKGRYKQYDDILATAYMALVTAIRNANKDSINLKGYIYKTIESHVKEYLRKDHLIIVPRTSFKEPFRFIYLDDPRNESFEIKDKRNEFINLNWEKLTKQEKHICKMIGQNYTYREIGVSLSVSHTTIIYYLKKIKEKLKR